MQQTSLVNKPIARHRGLFFLLALVVGFISVMYSPRPLFAEEPFIKDIIVSNSSKDLLVYFTVKNAFTPEMEKGVHNGIPITFTFNVVLERPRKGWTDQELASVSMDHTLSYDNLKEEYRIECSENGGKAFETKLLVEAEAKMMEVNGLKVIPLDRLIPDEHYKLSAMVYLDKNTLPFNFHYLIPFWGLWDFKTDWYTVEFRY